jgi:hypothetical protein
MHGHTSFKPGIRCIEGSVEPTVGLDVSQKEINIWHVLRIEPTSFGHCNVYDIAEAYLNETLPSLSVRVTYVLWNIWTIVALHLTVLPT